MLIRPTRHSDLCPFVSLILLGAVFLSLNACGSVDEGFSGTDDTDTDTALPVADVGTDDARPGDAEPVEDADGASDTSDINSCAEGVTPCERTADCREALDESFACDEGCCVARGGDPPCTRHLTWCADAAHSNDRFICDVELGQCIQRCADAETVEEEGANCPLNSYCFQYAGDDIPIDPTTGLALDGGCIPGDCTTMFAGNGELPELDTAACDGVDAVLEDVRCEEGTCICEPFGNGASYCSSVGTASEGQDCGDLNDDGSLSADELCDAEALCFRGECVAPCNARATEPGCGEQACVTPFDTTSRNQPGVCAFDCSAFSGGECPDGTACTPTWGRYGLNAWLCAESGGVELAVGEPCADIGGFDDCVEGAMCMLEEEDDPEGVCTRLCDPTGASTGALASCGSEDLICSVITIDGLGVCRPRCTPFPRVGEGNYECEGADQTCFPAYEGSGRATEISGVCQSGDPEGAAPGEACEEDGFFGGGCADFALCADFSEAGAGPVCNELCEPFAYDVDQCGEGSCNSVQPLFGNAFSFCETGAQPGAPFDRCTEEGFSCAADGTICLDMTGSGAQCWPVCRGGAEFDDCASFEGRTCRTGALNPDVVPGFMGLCQ